MQPASRAGLTLSSCSAALFSSRWAIFCVRRIPAKAIRKVSDECVPTMQAPCTAAGYSSRSASLTLATRTTRGPDRAWTSSWTFICCRPSRGGCPTATRTTMCRPTALRFLRCWSCSTSSVACSRRAILSLCTCRRVWSWPHATVRRLRPRAPSRSASAASCPRGRPASRASASCAARSSRSGTTPATRTACCELPSYATTTASTTPRSQL
mmetsp:Transcript_130767/g.419405  ORF Transcript_130767/g.419405 Transcript_130767/m.419405 type:complete len:211 (-) Transcript_130767:615-1247(-)